MNLSEQAWQKAAKVISATISHPFNQEMARGTLAHNKFSYYIEQDSIWLHDFGRCNAIIASKIKLEYAPIFLRHANNCFAAEKGIFDKNPDVIKTGLIAPTTISFSSYLVSICATQPVELAIAVILPCFWAYREVGLSIAANSISNNSYANWIKNYSSESFIESVDEVIKIFDELGENTSNEMREKMLDIFYKSTCLEWHFWNDAYNLAVFDDFKDTILIGADAEQTLIKDAESCQ
jgi:thiaminase/transcriptional activator TenA